MIIESYCTKLSKKDKTLLFDVDMSGIPHEEISDYVLYQSMKEIPLAHYSNDGMEYVNNNFFDCPSMSDDEYNALDKYSELYYDKLNYCIRQNIALSKTSNFIQHFLDLYIKKCYLKHDLVVYRGFDNCIEDHKHIANKIFKYRKFNDCAYLSTTLDFKTALRFSRVDSHGFDNIIVFNVPKGFNAISIPYTLHSYREQEILLPRNVYGVLKEIKDVFDFSDTKGTMERKWNLRLYFVNLINNTN